MSELLFFIVASLGLTHIFINGQIMVQIGLRPWIDKNWSKEWKQASNCYQCVGFWAGAFCGAVILVNWGYHSLDMFGGLHWLFRIPLRVFVELPLNILYWGIELAVCGFAGSFMGQFERQFEVFLESKTDIVFSEPETDGDPNDEPNEES